MQQGSNSESFDEKEISLKDIFNSIKLWFYYILSKWWIIVIIGLIGSSIAVGYRIFKPIFYTAQTSFIVEEGKTGSGSLASIAGQFGLDIATGASATLFSGDNILMFFKSNSLTKETLLTPYDSSYKYSLADKYAEAYELREKWAKSKRVGKEVFFSPKENATMSRLQDSLLHTIIFTILKKELIVERPEKRATFIVVKCSFKDEMLSKLFCERLVRKATDWYVDSKTKRQRINVERLEKRADSIERVLNGRTYYTATRQETTLDVNPAASTAAVNLEVSSRNKIMLSTIYGEVVKNLELAKVQLNQETPSIQLVDNPDLPLPKTKRMYIIFAIIGFIIFSFLSVGYFTIKRLIKE